jgi:hypothetical protein
MMAPMRESFSMFSRCTSLSGVSRTARTSRRRSLSTTSAALCTRFSQWPWATAANVRTLQGTMTMPSVTNEPLDTAAPWSFSG